MLSVVLATAAMPGFLSVRMGRVELTPPEPLSLGGYTARLNKPSEPGGQPLYARIAMLQQGDMKVALVSAEMLTIPESLVREVRKRLPPDVKLFLVATHTHCAPDSQRLNERQTIPIPGIARFDRKWLDWTAERIASGVPVGPSGFTYDLANLEVLTHPLPYNRSRRANGIPIQEATMVWANNVGAFMFPEFEVHVQAKRAVPLFFWFPAHATFWGPEMNKTHGDWPGAVSNILGGETLVFPGPIGGVSPAASGKDPSVRIGNLAFEVHARFITSGRKGRLLPTTSPLDFVEVPIALDPVVANPEFAKENRIPEALAKNVVQQIAPKEGTITAFRFGKLAVVGVPGEPSTMLGRRIRNAGRNLGFETTLVVSHVNGWIGYILEEWDFKKGGYEASLGFHGPKTGDRVVEAGIEALRRLSGRPPKTLAASARPDRSERE